MKNRLIVVMTVLAALAAPAAQAQFAVWDPGLDATVATGNATMNAINAQLTALNSQLTTIEGSLNAQEDTNIAEYGELGAISGTSGQTASAVTGKTALVDRVGDFLQQDIFKKVVIPLNQIIGPWLVSGTVFATGATNAGIGGAAYALAQNSASASQQTAQNTATQQMDLANSLNDSIQQIGQDVASTNTLKQSVDLNNQLMAMLILQVAQEMNYGAAQQLLESYDTQIDQGLRNVAAQPMVANQTALQP